MAVLKRFMASFVRWEYTFLCVLVVANLIMHFAVIQNPNTPVFDETHYVNDAKAILQDHTTNRTEHPPLGKLLFAASIALFGDNPFGWRTFPIIFGTINILFFYLICRRLQMSRKTVNIATFLLTFENLTFVQGSVAMLDVYSLTFMLLSFWLYLRRNYPLSGISVALATLAKLTGAFAIIVIFLHWLIVRRKGVVNFVASMLLAPVSFLLLMLAFELVIYRHPVDFVYYKDLMLKQSASLTFANTTHPYLILPWEILMIPRVMPYYYTPHYYGAISFTLWAFTIPAFIYMIVLAVKKNTAGLFGALWFAGVFLIFIPITLITDRVVYVYYFYPAVGSICIGIGLGLSRAIDFWREKRTGKSRWVALGGVLLFILLHLAVFIILIPLNPWHVETLFISTYTL